MSGGWSRVRAAALTVVDEWTPMITLDRSIIVSPKLHPAVWRVDANVLTPRLSWSGWMKATTRERLLMRRSWVTSAVWSC